MPRNTRKARYKKTVIQNHYIWQMKLIPCSASVLKMIWHDLDESKGGVQNKLKGRRQQQDIDAMKSMSNPLSIEERLGLLMSRYSRVIRRYSVQEILLEYCICIVLLVSVALVFLMLCFLRSRFCSGTSIGELTKCNRIF